MLFADLVDVKGNEFVGVATKSSTRLIRTSITDEPQIATTTMSVTAPVASGSVARHFVGTIDAQSICGTCDGALSRGNLADHPDHFDGRIV